MYALPAWPDGMHSRKVWLSWKKSRQNEMQEAELFSDRQGTLKGMIEDKIRMQSRATKNITNRFLRK